MRECVLADGHASAPAAAAAAAAMLDATIQLGAGESDLSPAYAQGARGGNGSGQKGTHRNASVALRNNHPSDEIISQTERARIGSASSPRVGGHGRPGSGSNQASPTAGLVHKTSAPRLQRMFSTSERHEDPSDWQLPLSFRKTKEEIYAEAEMRMLNNASYLQSLFFGNLGIALAAVPQVVLACLPQVCCFYVTDLYGEAARNLTVPQVFFSDEALANFSSNSSSDNNDGEFSLIANPQRRVLLTYFVAFILQMAGWCIYAALVWCKVFRSWMKQQRYVVAGLFQWTAIVISFAELVLGRPAFFSAQFFVLLSCVYKFSRAGFRWGIAAAAGVLWWYVLRARSPGTR